MFVATANSLPWSETNEFVVVCALARHQLNFADTCIIHVKFEVASGQPQHGYNVVTM